MKCIGATLGSRDGKPVDQATIDRIVADLNTLFAINGIGSQFVSATPQVDAPNRVDIVFTYSERLEAAFKTLSSNIRVFDTQTQ
jgi:hypothetical protein